MDYEIPKTVLLPIWKDDQNRLGAYGSEGTAESVTGEVWVTREDLCLMMKRRTND